LESHQCHGGWCDVSPELAASAILGAAAKLGQPMRSIEERSVEQVLALAANAGNSTEHARPPWGFLNCLGFLFALSFYYVIGVFLLLAIYKDQPYDDVPINMNVAVNLLISSILAYFSARQRPRIKFRLQYCSIAHLAALTAAKPVLSASIG
jgi:hypothetical protein